MVCVARFPGLVERFSGLSKADYMQAGVAAGVGGPQRLRRTLLFICLC